MDNEEKFETVNALEPIEEEGDMEAQTYSPEPMKEETQEVEEEAGSFSPELLHGDENEEAIDPEEDRATLVYIYIY